MADDLLKKDLITHKIYSSWQFVEYTEKNIATVHYCADTINNIISKMTMKTVRWQQDIASDFIDDVTENGKKVKRLSVTTENAPTYEVRVAGEKVDPWFLFDKLLRDFFQYTMNAFDSISQIINAGLLEIKLIYCRKCFMCIEERRQQMKFTDMTIEEMCTTTEKQSFDRKSAKIEATAIATPMIAFANADGGLLAVGIEDNGEITGIDDYTKNINEILRAGYDFCQPFIFIEKETIDCIDKNGNANHILLIKVPQSADMHVNHRDEAFLRVGDRSKKLTFDERMELMYSKGMRFYEDEPVYRSTLDDIDMEFVAKYCEKIGYGKTPEEYIRQNKDYIVSVAGRQEMSGAAIMMFGKDPQRFFPRSRVRFIRYEGTEAKVGAEMNVIKDKMFQGRILDLVEQTIEYVRTQIKEHTYLGPDARFVTEPEYPEFAWKEIIVNAIAHRDYSIKGTDIQIKMFDDHITVESPGTLPGTVRLKYA